MSKHVPRTTFFRLSVLCNCVCNCLVLTVTHAFFSERYIAVKSVCCQFTPPLLIQQKNKHKVERLLQHNILSPLVRLSSVCVSVQCQVSSVKSDSRLLVGEVAGLLRLAEHHVPFLRLHELAVCSPLSVVHARHHGTIFLRGDVNIGPDEEKTTGKRGMEKRFIHASSFHLHGRDVPVV